MIYLSLLIVLPFIFMIALLYSIKPALGIGLAGALFLTLIVWHSLEFGLFMSFLTIPFDRCAFITRNANLTAAKVFIAITILMWLTRALVTKDSSVLKSLYHRKTSILVLCYLMVSILTIVNAKDVTRAVAVLVRRTNVLVLYFLIINLVRSKKLLNQVISILLLSGFLISLIGMYELVTADSVLPESVGREQLSVTAGGEGASRIQGCAGNGDFHSAILIMLLPFLLTRIQTTKEKHRKIIGYGFLIFYIVNIFGTNARQGLLGIMIAFMTVFLLSEIRFKFLKLGAAFALLALIFGIFSLMPEKFMTERYTGESGLKSIEYRLGWIVMSWEMVKKHPFLGVGTGNYFTEYNRYVRAAPDMIDPVPLMNHNGIMQVWAENGTVGLVIFLLLLFSVPFELFRGRNRALEDQESKALRIGILAGFLNYLLCIGVIPALENEVGWIVIAFSAVFTNLEEQKSSLRDTVA